MTCILESEWVVLRAVLNCECRLVSVTRVVPDHVDAVMAMPRLQTMRLDPVWQDRASAFRLIDGVCRVSCLCDSDDGVTLGFLQAGDCLRMDGLCPQGVVIEAVTPLTFCREVQLSGAGGIEPIHEWTMHLLRVRHLAQVEQRLQAVMALLVNRMGIRCRDAFRLPFRLTHERLGELIGATRVTTTRLLSRWRKAELIDVLPADSGMRLSLQLIDGSPLRFD